MISAIDDRVGQRRGAAPGVTAALETNLTEADSPDISAGTAAGGSWTYCASGDTADFVGGWA